MTKNEVLHKLDKIALLVDEMIYEGVLINADEEDLTNKLSGIVAQPLPDESSQSSIFGGVTL